jgi:hypothetical protein
MQESPDILSLYSRHREAAEVGQTVDRRRIHLEKESLPLEQGDSWLQAEEEECKQAVLIAAEAEN